MSQSELLRLSVPVDWEKVWSTLGNLELILLGGSLYFGCAAKEIGPEISNSARHWPSMCGECQQKVGMGA